MAKSNEKDALSGLADNAQPLAGPHSAELRTSASSSPQSLADLAGQRVAVRIPIGGRGVVVKGQAVYQGGHGLRIQLDDEVMTEVCIDPAAWNGRVAQDREHGCDYFIALDIQPAPAQAAR